MNPPPRPAPSHVPTLTEVIEVPDALPTGIAPLAPPPEAVQPAIALPTDADPAAETGMPRPAISMPVAAPLPPVPFPVAGSPAPPLAAPLVPPATPALPALPATTPSFPARVSPGIDEAAMAQRVLAEVQRQIDGMLEYRLREALTPILARTAESLVRELRQELSKTMRDVVSRAVAQEVARQRTRP